MPMRGLSTNALINYRKRARKYNDLDASILKIRLNCFIEASNNVTYNLNGKVYQFGSCIITVNSCNVIRDVEWTKEPISASPKEVARMHKLFYENGLNKNGTAFLEDVKKKK